MTEILGPEKFYNDRVNNYGLSSKSIGWKNYEQQKLRFDYLTSTLDLNNKIIMDIGCGFGDLANYLAVRNIHFKQYIGIDISENMLLMAEQNVETKLPVCFSKLNILKDDISFDPDIAIMSGLLNLKQSHLPPLELLDLFLRKTRAIVKEGLVFNLLTDQVDYQQAQHIHFNTSEVRLLSEKYFNKVSICKDYGLYEFTVSALL